MNLLTEDLQVSVELVFLVHMEIVECPVRWFLF